MSLEPSARLNLRETSGEAYFFNTTFGKCFSVLSFEGRLAYILPSCCPS